MPVEEVPSWIKQALIPEFNEIKGELKAINARIDSVEHRINGLESNLNIKIDSLRNETKMKIGSLRTEMIVRLDSIEKRIPVIEKIATLDLRSWS